MHKCISWIYSFNILENIYLFRIIMIKININWQNYFISLFKKYFWNNILTRKEKWSEISVHNYYIPTCYFLKVVTEDVVERRYGSKWTLTKNSNSILESSINRINLILVSHKCSCIFYLIMGFNSSNFSLTYSISKVRKLLLFKNWQWHGMFPKEKDKLQKAISLNIFK